MLSRNSGTKFKRICLYHIPILHHAPTKTDPRYIFIPRAAPDFPRQYHKATKFRSTGCTTVRRFVFFLILVSHTLVDTVVMTAYFHKLSPGDRVGAIALPPFHSLGITMQLYLPLAYLVTIAVYPPQTTSNRREIPIVPTSDNILDGVCRTHCKVVITVPALLEQWAVSIDAVEVLAKLDRVVSVNSASFDGTLNHIFCRFVAAVQSQTRSGMRCGQLVSTSALRMAEQNLVLLSLREAGPKFSMGNGCGYSSQRTYR